MTNSPAKKVAGETVTEVAANDAGFTPVNRNTLFTSTKQIEAAIAEANLKGQDLQKMYQVILCSAILHLATHKDIRVIRNLLEALPEGMRKQSMAAFIDKFAPVTFDEKGAISYNSERKLDLNGALNFPWWKAAKEQVYKPFVLVDKVARILKEAEKAFTKGETTAEELAAVRNLFATLNKPATVSEDTTEEQPVQAIAA